MALRDGTLRNFLFLSLVVFHSLKCNQAKTTVDKVMEKWNDYVQTLKLQENSSMNLNTKTKTNPKIDDNLQVLFQQLIDKLKPIIEYKDPTFIEHIDFTTDTPLIKFKGFMNSVKLSGMGQFSVDKLNVTQDLYFDLGFGFPNLMVEGYYDLDCNVLSLLPFYGDGDFGLLLTGFNISLSMNFQEGPENLQATDIKLDFKLNKTQMELDGFAGGGNVATFINTVLSDVGAQLLMQYKDVLLNLINPMLMFEMNAILAEKNITIEFIVNAIKEFLKRT